MAKDFVEHVLPEAHHHLISKKDDVSLLEFDLDEQTSLQKSSSTSSNLFSLSEPSLGIFEEVFASDRQDYDSDDDYAYDELSGPYLRILDSAIAEPFLKVKSGIFRKNSRLSDSGHLVESGLSIAAYLSSLPSDFCYSSVQQTENIY